MHASSTLSRCVKGLSAHVIILGFILLGILDSAFGQSAQPTPHPPIEVEHFDVSDFVTFFKYFLAVCGGFIAILALMSLAFFGFDIRKARSSIQSEFLELRAVVNEARISRNEARQEQERGGDRLRALVKEGEEILTRQKQSQLDQEKELFKLQQNIQDKLHDANEKLHQLDALYKRLEAQVNDAEEVGSILEEYVDSGSSIEPSAPETKTKASRPTQEYQGWGSSAAPSSHEQTAGRPTQENQGWGSSIVPSSAETETETRRSMNPQRSKEDLIREVVKSSKFTWTTIGRIMNKTGLDRNEILTLARAMPDIQISRGRKSGDHIFRF